MKKSIVMVCCLLLSIGVSACAQTEAEAPQEVQGAAVNVEEDLTASVYEVATEEEVAAPVVEVDGVVDLTTLSSTMVYAEVYNMMSNPDSYIGKTVKMEGQFLSFEDPDTQNVLTACLIVDATACCAQGIMFELQEGEETLEEYPEQNAYITVVGTYETYEENGILYCHLVDATMEVYQG